MSKVLDIREVCGDYALDVEYSADYTFTMFFNSRRNAETVKRCIEVDDSVPNVATAVDFVEVVRCKDCKRCKKFKRIDGTYFFSCRSGCFKEVVSADHYCSYGERREE